MPCEAEHDVRLAAADIAVTVPLPPRAGEGQPAAVDTDGVPGAREVLGVRWDVGAGAELRLGCLAAPVPAWVAGLERAVLDGATARVRKLGDLDAMHQGEPLLVAGHWEQSYGGESAARTVVGRHLFGFVGPDREAMLCSLACRHPGSEAAPCGAAVADARFEVAWQPPPAEGIGGRLVALAVARPSVAAVLSAAVTLLVVAVILRLRPRPRR